MTSKPQPITYTIESIGHTISLNDPRQLIVEQGRQCIDGGRIIHKGKETRVLVAYDGKPELAAQVAAFRQAWDEYKAAEAAEFARNVPGLDELRAARSAAYNEEERYSRQFQRMMDDEYNDGARPPRPVNESLLSEAIRLAEQYPRAAVYLEAEGYEHASNYHKSGAGSAAKKLIAAGGDLEEARNILKNWLPESALWN